MQTPQFVYERLTSQHEHLSAAQEHLSLYTNTTPQF